MLLDVFLEGLFEMDLRRVNSEEVGLQAAACCAECMQGPPLAANREQPDLQAAGSRGCPRGRQQGRAHRGALRALVTLACQRQRRLTRLGRRGTACVGHGARARLTHSQTELPTGPPLPPDPCPTPFTPAPGASSPHRWAMP